MSFIKWALKLRLNLKRNCIIILSFRLSFYCIFTPFLPPPPPFSLSFKFWPFWTFMDFSSLCDTYLFYFFHFQIELFYFSNVSWLSIFVLLYQIELAVFLIFPFAPFIHVLVFSISELTSIRDTRWQRDAKAQRQIVKKKQKMVKFDCSVWKILLFDF